MTSNSDKEIIELLEILKSTHSGTYVMHESFNVEKYSKN